MDMSVATDCVDVNSIGATDYHGTSQQQQKQQNKTKKMSHKGENNNTQSRSEQALELML